MADETVRVLMEVVGQDNLRQLEAQVQRDREEIVRLQKAIQSLGATPGGMGSPQYTALINQQKAFAQSIVNTNALIKDQKKQLDTAGFNGQRATTAGMMVMNVGAMVEDAQYGFRAVANQLPMLGMQLAMLSGKSMATGMAVGGLTALVATLGYQLYASNDAIKGFIDSIGTGFQDTLRSATFGLYNPPTELMQRMSATADANQKTGLQAFEAVGGIGTDEQATNARIFKEAVSVFGGKRLQAAMESGPGLDQAGRDKFVKEALQSILKSDYKASAMASGSGLATMSEFVTPNVDIKPFDPTIAPTQDQVRRAEAQGGNAWRAELERRKNDAGMVLDAASHGRNIDNVASRIGQKDRADWDRAMEIARDREARSSEKQYTARLRQATNVDPGIKADDSLTRKLERINDALAEFGERTSEVVETMVDLNERYRLGAMSQKEYEAALARVSEAHETLRKKEEDLLETRRLTRVDIAQTGVRVNQAHADAIAAPGLQGVIARMGMGPHRPEDVAKFAGEEHRQRALEALRARFGAARAMAAPGVGGALARQMLGRQAQEAENRMIFQGHLQEFLQAPDAAGQKEAAGKVPVNMRQMFNMQAGAILQQRRMGLMPGPEAFKANMAREGAELRLNDAGNVLLDAGQLLLRAANQFVW